MLFINMFLNNLFWSNQEIKSERKKTQHETNWSINWYKILKISWVQTASDTFLLIMFCIYMDSLFQSIKFRPLLFTKTYMLFNIYTHAFNQNHINIKIPSILEKFIFIYKDSYLSHDQSKSFIKLCRFSKKISSY